MKFRCPYCRHEYDYEDMQMDADLLACIRMLPTFGQHANLVMAYTELFGISPLKTRRKKWRLLLEEMKRLFDSETFDFTRRRYKISRAGIAEALNVVVHRSFDMPLKSHGYLKAVMISISERDGKTAGVEAEKTLRKKEAALMSGNRGHESAGTRCGSPPQAETHRAPGRELAAPGTSPDAQRAENLRRVRELTEKIG